MHGNEFTSSTSNRCIVAKALKSCRGAFIAVGVFSGVINILTLGGSLYMLQVYDRVLNSQSLPTLIGLSLLLLASYTLQGFLDTIRVRMLARVGARFDEQISRSVFFASHQLPLQGFRASQAVQPLRDLDQVRGFLASLGPTALLDMPWMPIFFLGCFLLHPALGCLALVGGGIILLLAWLTEVNGRSAVKAQMASGTDRQVLIEASRRNAGVLAAMGMAPAFQRKWQQINKRHISDWLSGADAASDLGAFAKVFRMMLQSAVLGLGAYLAMNGEISGGAMIAASIMTARALAPIEIAVAHWRGFIAARQGVGHLKQVLDGPAFLVQERTSLPIPRRELIVNNLIVAPPRHQTPILRGVSLRLRAGQGLAIIGPSAAGKSTLLRALVGIWRPLKGEVRLDGATLNQWTQAELGRYLGYLPQDIELFDGTVAQNIARFDQNASDGAVVSAAQAAGAHELILQLDKGYDTDIGEGGIALSGGQRQRLGLARALYGDPFLVILDEPNSNLDQDGDDALTAAVLRIRERGGIVVIATHRKAAIAGVDQIAMMADGRIHDMGPKEEIQRKIIGRGRLQEAQRPPVAS